MSKKKHIALVTTWFPPQQGVATNRMLAFANFLSDHHTITVFCLGDENNIVVEHENLTVVYVKSNSFLVRLKSKQSDTRFKHNFKTLIRVILLKLLKHPLKKWTLGTIKQLQSVHGSKGIDVVISSYAPAETHLVALTFVKENKEVQWIADMRDEMSINPGINIRQKRQFVLLEAQINEFAFALSTVSAPILQAYKSMCPKVKNFLEVRNGFSHDLKNDFTSKNEIFTLGYFGSFYGDIKPSHFFQALILLRKQNPEFEFKFYIVGAHNNFEIPHEIKDFIELLPPVEYEDAIRLMMKMDANVLINPRSIRKGVYTGKLFDYISANVPIIACLDTDDVAAQLINELNIGYVAECVDVTSNSKAIQEAYNDWHNGNVKRMDENLRALHHRKHQVQKLVDFINELPN